VSVRDNQLFLLVLIAAIAAVVGFFLNTNRAAVREAEARLNESRRRESEAKGELAALSQKHESLSVVLKETSSFYPSLAAAIADFAVLEDEQRARYLGRKSHPALKSAERVREAARARRDAERRAKILEYQLTYYEDAFPWLVDFAGRTTEDLLAELEKRRKGEVLSDDDDDPVKRFVALEEYARLSEAERSDLALRRWRESRKSNWQIGRDYERAVGYEYEQKGYSVEYFGAVKGLEDMGRDLIARRADITYVIQCKYWAKEKVIHEKHIFQLIGTCFEYACKSLDRDVKGLDLSSLRIVPLLITNIRLSERASAAARIVGVKFQEEHPKHDYPLVKCNINGRNKIYHLPFDQQYDTARINANKGEAYMNTAAEAERRGFRRARRHYPDA
jgi:hypothetical protein